MWKLYKIEYDAEGVGHCSSMDFDDFEELMFIAKQIVESGGSISISIKKK